MQLFQINQCEESSKITINAHTTSCPLHQLPITTASTLLLLLAQHPHFQGSIMDGQGYIITIIIFSILYNIVKFFEFETVTVLHEDEVSGEMWVKTRRDCECKCHYNMSAYLHSVELRCPKWTWPCWDKTLCMPPHCWSSTPWLWVSRMISYADS